MASTERITSGVSNFSSLPSSTCIPVVDLNGEDTSIVVQQIKDAVREHGFFQLLDDESGSSTRHDHRHPLHVPEARIDIQNDGGEGVYPGIYQDQWKTYIDHLKKYSKPDDEIDDPMKMMYGTLKTVAGQVLGSLVAYRLCSSSTVGSSWPTLAVELATVLGLSVAMVGMILRGKRKRSAVSALMIKIGAMTIASTIIFSMVLHLPQEIAWIVGTVAVLIMTAVAFTAFA